MPIYVIEKNDQRRFGELVKQIDNDCYVRFLGTSFVMNMKRKVTRVSRTQQAGLSGKPDPDWPILVNQEYEGQLPEDKKNPTAWRNVLFTFKTTDGLRPRFRVVEWDCGRWGVLPGWHIVPVNRKAGSFTKYLTIPPDNFRIRFLRGNTPDSAEYAEACAWRAIDLKR